MDLEQVARDYDRDGYVFLDGLFDADSVAELSRLCDEIVQEATEVEAETELFDLEESHRKGRPRVRRIKKPHNARAVYFEAARHPHLLPVVQRLLGPAVRLHHSKINLKSARFGAPLEWHQDWAFIPHSRMALAIAAIMLDDVDEANGPMLVIPGSHRQGLRDHHREGYFVGAIEPDELDLSKAVAMTGKAGSLSLHHPLLVHGSALNESTRNRRVLFYEYAAADAWPLFYGVEYGDYNRRLLSGEPTNEPAFDGSFVRLPLPVRHQGSIYNNQRDVKKRHFKTYEEEGAQP